MIDKYLGIPFKHRGRDEKGIDCYGLVVLLFERELGIKLFDVEGYNRQWSDKNYFLSHYHIDWVKVGKLGLKKYDVLLFTDKEKEVIPKHIGIYIEDGKFLHCLEHMPVGMSRLNNLWLPRFHSAYRHKNLIEVRQNG